jgi:hypothetical protein
MITANIRQVVGRRLGATHMFFQTQPGYVRARVSVVLVVSVTGVLMAGSIALGQTAASGAHASGPKYPTSTRGVEVVYINQFHSVEPKSITRPPGPFLLVIENRTTLPVLNLRVLPAIANAVAVAAGALSGKSIQFPLDLPAGKYVISESSRSDWAIDLEIK